jgi:nicotinic acid phosphoribosyltransferase
MAVFTTADTSTLNMGMHWLNVWFSENLLAPVTNEARYTAEEIDQVSRKIKAASDHLTSFSQRHDG